MTMSELCGVFPVVNYTESILREAGTGLDAKVSSIIVALIQLIGAYITTLLVDRLGRRVSINLNIFSR